MTYDCRLSPLLTSGLMNRLVRFGWIVIGWNVVTIMLGALVRATHSGAGCGRSWPTCRGEVLPEVGSMMVPPGRSSPSRSAASIIDTAIRSLTDPPGFTCSSLATRFPGR